MSAPDSLTHETILATVREWPVEERLALLHEVLQTLHPDAAPREVHRPTLSRALGLAATDQPAPDDTTVKAWLAERRQAKYG